MRRTIISLKWLFSILFFISLVSIAAKRKTTVREIKATYEDAIVYTGYTGYFFKETKTGKKIEIQKVSGASNVKAPGNLLEDASKIEGLPGANPEMVGKTFTIRYLKGDKITITQSP